MSVLDKRRNGAVYTNPPILQGRVADIHITEHGSNWLWTVFSLFGVATLALLFLTLRKPVAHRAIHYLLTAIIFVAVIDYYAIASDLGFAPIPVEFQRTRHTVAGSVRQIWYSRYIDWFVSGSLMLLTLLLVAQAHWQKILFVVVLEWTAVVSGLAGALTPTKYKWGFFLAALFSISIIAYSLIVPGRRQAIAIGTDIGRTYSIAAIWLVFLGFLYPIAWGLSEGGNVIAPDSEQIFYGILDLFSKFGLAGILLWGLRDIAPERLGFRYHGFEENGVSVTKA